MMNAYDKNYLEKARVTLGIMFDYAINNLGYSLRDFYDIFLISSISKKIENGDSSIIAGTSGIELCLKILNLENAKEASINEGKTQEYWLGYSLSYYQWKSGLSFFKIDNTIPIENIIGMYSPYHELDINHFCDRLDEIMNSKEKILNLKRIRNSLGLTQNQLSIETGIPLRTIQQYEQGQKNINCANTQYLLLLSKVLYCSIEDLLEYKDNNQKITFNVSNNLKIKE